MDLRLQKQEAKSEWRPVGLRSSSERGLMREMTEVVHSGALDLTRVSSSELFFCDSDEPVAVVRTVLHSQENEISPGTVIAMGRERKGMVKQAFEEGIEI